MQIQNLSLLFCHSFLFEKSHSVLNLAQRYNFLLLCCWLTLNHKKQILEIA